MTVLKAVTTHCPWNANVAPMDEICWTLIAFVTIATNNSTNLNVKPDWYSKKSICNSFPFPTLQISNGYDLQSLRWHICLIMHEQFRRVTTTRLKSKGKQLGFAVILPSYKARIAFSSTFLLKTSGIDWNQVFYEEKESKVPPCLSETSSEIKACFLAMLHFEA